VVVGVVEPVVESWPAAVVAAVVAAASVAAVSVAAAVADAAAEADTERVELPTLAKNSGVMEPVRRKAVPAGGSQAHSPASWSA
jgi:hypothetical protein